MKESVCNEGLVTAIKEDKVYVEYNQPQACMSCFAQKKCNISKYGNLSFELNQLDDEYLVGDKVKIVQGKASVKTAIYLAFIIPLFLLISSLFISQLILNDEIMGSTFSFVLLVFYYLVLYLKRAKLGKEFAVEIRHL